MLIIAQLPYKLIHSSNHTYKHVTDSATMENCNHGRVLHIHKIRSIVTGQVAGFSYENKRAGRNDPDLSVYLWL